MDGWSSTIVEGLAFIAIALGLLFFFFIWAAP